MQVSAIAGLVGNWAGASASFLLGGASALGAVLIAACVMLTASVLGEVLLAVLDLRTRLD